jgi:DNA-directed RNA polymerase subunit RPC12/RpoP
MSNLKQLKCPSCWATLNQSFPDQLIVECPYCHQQVVNTDAYKTANVGKGEEPRILEFKLEIKDVINLLINDLINDQNVPRDIFDKMRISSTKQYYVPMYIFEGTYRAPWSAKIPREVKKQRLNYQGKLEDYYETVYDYPSGEVAGNFIINCFSHEESIHLNLTNPNICLSPTSLPVFSQVSIGKDIVLIAPSEDTDSVWRERGYAAVKNQAASEAEYQAQGYLTNCSTSCELKKTWLVYIPIWVIDYNYENHSYRFTYYAEQIESINKPYVEVIQRNPVAAQPTIEQKAALDRFNKLNGILYKIQNIGCSLIAGIGLIGCVYINYKVSNMSHVSSDGYWEHKNDQVVFLFKFIVLGILLLIIISVINYFYRTKKGIVDIEDDIANRTKILEEEAENEINKKLYEAEKYKRETGKAYLNAFSGGNEFNCCDNQQIKKCIHCGKEINVSHMFCRYCGAQQN